MMPALTADLDLDEANNGWTHRSRPCVQGRSTSQVGDRVVAGQSLLALRR